MMMSTLFLLVFVLSIYSTECFVKSYTAVQSTYRLSPQRSFGLTNERMRISPSEVKLSHNIPTSTFLVNPAQTAISIMDQSSMISSADQNSFLIPLVISVLTMVPFLYYSQALKPKERTVKQIEIDPKTLKAVNSKDSTGSTGQARASKKN